MKRWFAFAPAVLALVALPVLAATLSVGATAPAFSAPASLAGHDFTFSLKKALAKGPVVVYFFPAAFTQGCDIEAHTFSTHKAQFVKAGATIIGVSEDSVATLNKFSSDPKYCAGKFPVVSNPSGSIGTQYGVPMSPPMHGATNVNHQPVTHGFFARTTFVIGRDGRVVATFSTMKDHITPAEHVTKSLAIVRKLHADKAL